MIFYQNRILQGRSPKFHLDPPKPPLPPSRRAGNPPGNPQAPAVRSPQSCSPLPRVVYIIQTPIPTSTFITPHDFLTVARNKYKFSSFAFAHSDAASVLCRPWARTDFKRKNPCSRGCDPLPSSKQSPGYGDRGGVGNLCCAQGVGNLCCARGVGGEGEKVVLAACLRSGPEDLEDRNAIRGVRGFCG